jgi:fructose-1,6-bisphosphatase/sedoheptulose 1,7-bisphosphatase-like protein
MSDPRRINLSVPADYLSQPTEKVRDWLRQNTAALRALGETEIVTRVRSALGAQITALNDGDIAVDVREWAKDNGIRLPGQAAGPGPGESEMVARVKKIGSCVATVQYVVLSRYDRLPYNRLAGR